MSLRRILSVGVLFPVLIIAQVNIDTIGDNNWVRLPWTGQGFNAGGDVHGATDTSGNMYIFGGCTMGNGAGGSHNGDVYRANLKTGKVDKIATCGSLWWKGGCQAGQAYDASRNCVWVSGGLSGICASGAGTVNTMWKFICPDGPMQNMGEKQSERVSYMRYDPINDLAYCVSYDPVLYIYDCKVNTWSTSSYPFRAFTPSAVPCCVDTKRGLFVITLTGDYTITNPATQVTYDVWFYNGGTGQWHKKTPAVTPQFYKAELAYDSKNDKYVYFGVGHDGCTSEVWAYDYETNVWTQMSSAGLAYNDANPTLSTWAPGRTKHNWEYCEKFNVFANYGGGNWIPSQCSDIDGLQPIWLYRLAKDSFIVTAPERRKNNRPYHGFIIFPNPFSSGTTLFIPSGVGAGERLELAVYNIQGEILDRQVLGLGENLDNGNYWRNKDWNTGCLKNGIYLFKLRSRDKAWQTKGIFLR